MRSVILIILAMVFALGTASGNDNRERYMEGVEHYKGGRFTEAAEIWMELYNSGYDNFELLYNAGNAWFKLDEIPLAILFYERASLRKPGDEDLNYNLAIARTLIKDRFETIPQFFFIRWFNLASLRMTSDAWALLSLITFISTLVLALGFLFTARYNIKIITFWVALAMFLASSSSLALSYRSRTLVYNNSDAIITAPVITGRSTPSESGMSLFVIHEGLKVKTGEEIGGWCEIRLPDGNKGWVPDDTFERI